MKDAHYFGTADIELDPVLQFFDYQHLPDYLAIVSAKFAELAEEIVAKVPRNAQRTQALNKLLEAKDCAVRAQLAE